MKKYNMYLRNLMSSVLLILVFQLSTMAQVEGIVTLANETSVGTDYFFDIYLHESAGSSGPIYLGDSQFRISFDIAKFTNPSLEQVANPGSLFGQEDGWSTLVPLAADGAFNDAITRNNYYNSISVSIPVSKGKILNIELNGPGPGNQNALDTRVAKIDDKMITHRLGRYKITGYKETGNPDLALIYGGSFGTVVQTYEATPPFTLSGVTLSTGALPVEWVSFTAKEINHQEVQLEWITGAELNNDRFEIEKQLKHGEFQKIGTVASLGNSTNPRTYQFFDSSPMTDVVYYRIKQIDLDGTFEYSTTQEVRFDFNGNQTYSVYPSPATDEITIEALDDTQQTHEFWVLDLRGREILKGELEAGVAFSNVDISKLAEGNYFIKIKSPNADIFHLKFTKK